MLRGESAIKMDAKGRMALPTRSRAPMIERCDGNMVVTVNTDRKECLWLYPLDEWEKVERKITALSTFNEEHQKLKRFFLGSAVDVQMDAATGRVLIPAKLREFAHLSKEISLVGSGNKYEVWDGSRWDASLSDWAGVGISRDNLSDEMRMLQL